MQEIKIEQTDDWDVNPLTSWSDDILGIHMGKDSVYLENLERDNTRLQNALVFATNECNVLNNENNDLSHMLEKERDLSNGYNEGWINQDDSYDILPSVLVQSGAFDGDLQEEITRKEYVIQAKDKKATRLIDIIRDKNAQIDSLKHKLEDYKWRNWDINEYNIELERRLNNDVYYSN